MFVILMVKLHIILMIVILFRNLYNPSIFTLNSFIRGRNINVKSSLPTDIPFSEEKNK